MLNIHIPYRLTHIDGLCWACDVLNSGNQSTTLSLVFDRDVKNKQLSILDLTNPLAEIGLLYCRVLLNFLGLRFDKRDNAIVEILNPGSEDNFSIVKLDLPALTPADLELAPTGESKDIIKSCIRTLLSINKGVAHFTDSNSSRSYTQDAQLCGKTVIWLVEEYVYKKLDYPIPPFKVWTGA